MREHYTCRPLAHITAGDRSRRLSPPTSLSKDNLLHTLTSLVSFSSYQKSLSSHVHHTPVTGGEINMRLPHCIASLCLASNLKHSTAFIQPIPGSSTALQRTRSSLATRAQQQHQQKTPFASTSLRHTATFPTPASVMSANPPSSSLSIGTSGVDASSAALVVGIHNKPQPRLFSLGAAKNILSNRRRRGEGNPDGGVVGGRVEKEEGRRVSSRGRRGWVRRTMAGVAAALVLRTSFAPASVSAIPLGGVTGRRSVSSDRNKAREMEAERVARRNQLKQKQFEEDRAAQLAAETELEEALHEPSETQSESELDTAAAAAEGMGDSGSLAHAGVGAAMSVGGEVAPGTRAMLGGEELQASGGEGKVQKRKQTKEERERYIEQLRKQLKDPTFNPNTVAVAPEDHTFGSIVSGSVLIVLVLGALKGSTVVMESQRKRVRVESSKFEQQKEEWMDVEGEAEVDVDIMKELRDLKEKMAGPGDDYAKDTRAYNPDFAKDHPEEEYETKIQEAMRQRERLAKKRNEAFMKKKQLETQDTDIEASEDGLSDDFLGQGNGGDAESAEELASSRQDLDVDEGEVAKQAKKAADVKRLQDMFNNSPSEDGDLPEDDLGDKRELLP